MKRTIKFDEESTRHFKQKVRLARIFFRYGWHPTVERRMPCLVTNYGKPFRCRYRVDCFAWKGDRQIICEIDGYIGHKTSAAHNAQRIRLIRIRERYGRNIEEFRWTFPRLAKWTNEEIAQEMRL